MNKIFTLLAAAGLAMSANAAVVWEGSVVMGNWKGELDLSCESVNWTPEAAAAFGDLAAGDKIVFHYTDVSTDSEAPGQIQIDAKVGPSWTWTAIVEYDNIVDGKYTYTCDDAPIGDTDYTDVETLSVRGLFVKGQNATLTKIEIVPAGGDVPTTTDDLWTGSVAMGSWTGELDFSCESTAWTAQVAAKMKSLKVGDKLVFTYEDCAANAQIALYCKVGSAWTWTEIVPYADIANGSYTYKITDELAGDTDYTVLETISERGFFVKGQGATLVKIAVVSKEGGDNPVNPDEPVQPTTGTEIWNGEVVMGAWKGMLEYKPLETNTQWNATAMNSMEEGSKLVFHYTDVVGTDEAPAQIQLATFGLDAAWSWVELVAYDNVVNGKYTYVVTDAPAGDSDYTDLEMLKEHGFAVKGQNATLVKIELINPGAGVENVAADNKIDFDTPVEIYTIDGRRVAEMTPGRIYIVRQGNKVVKLAK